jgi:hypothetical protein
MRFRYDKLSILRGYLDDAATRRRALAGAWRVFGVQNRAGRRRGRGGAGESSCDAGAQLDREIATNVNTEESGALKCAARTARFAHVEAHVAPGSAKRLHVLVAAVSTPAGAHSGGAFFGPQGDFWGDPEG